MPVPVWAALLAVAVAKKVVLFTAAKVPSQPRTTKVFRLTLSQACLGLKHVLVQVYGFPRLYRKQQQLARWLVRDKATLKVVSGRIGYLYRAPNTLSGENAMRTVWRRMSSCPASQCVQ